MPVEAATFINDLVVTNPVGASDPKGAGDDHLRLLKTVLKASFPNMTAVGVHDLVAALNFLIKSTGNGAAPGPNLKLQALNAGLTDGQYAGSVIWEFLSDLGASRIGAQDVVQVNDVSDGTEDTTRIFRTMVGGVLTDRLIITPTEATFDGTSLSAFPAGTRMAFQQTAAPTGWTKDVTHNNKALRLVNGAVTTGGTVAFTTAFASQSVAGSNSNTIHTGTIGSTAITSANMPAHTHTFNETVISGTQSANHTHPQTGTFATTTTGAHTHSISFSQGADGDPGTGGGSDVTHADPADTVTGSSGNHSHNVTISGDTGTNSVSHTHAVTVSGTTSSTGSGTGHTHTFTGDAHTHTFSGTPIDLAVQFVDFIIAEKD